MHIHVFIIRQWLRGSEVVCGSEVQGFSGSIPAQCGRHVEVSLGKTLNLRVPVMLSHQVGA